MLSNHNLEMLLEKIFDNEETVNRIMATNDMHELYNLCLSIQDGYSFEEFSEFFDELVMTCGKALSELDEDDLSDVSGGAAIGLRKIAATTLASLSVISSVPSFGKAEEAPNNTAAGTTISAKVTDEIEPRKADIGANKQDYTNSNGAWRKFLNFLDKTTDKVWDNRGGFLLLGAGMLAGGMAIDKSAGALSGYFQARKIYAKQLETYNKEYNDKEKNKREVEKLEWEAREKKVESERDYKRLAEKRTSGNQDPELPDDEEVRAFNESVEFGNKAESLKAEKERLEQDLRNIEKNKPTAPGEIKLRQVAPTAAKLLGVPGLALAAGKWVIDRIHDVGKIGEDFRNIGMAVLVPMFHFNQIKQMVDHMTEGWFKENYDPEIAEQKLDNVLNKLVRGQDEAKSQIKKFFRTVNNARDRDRKGITPMKGAFVTVFNGPSGTGKTYTAEILTACLTNSKPYIISAADINKRIEDAKRDGMGSSPSVANILFTSMRKSGSGSGGYDVNDNSLSEYIHNHPKDGVVIIDEYDKLFDKRTQDKHPLDEVFRNLVDKGQIEDQRYGKVDASGIVFILTTNETTASLKGKIENVVVGSDDQKTNVMKLREVVGVDENGDKKYAEPKTDKFGTQTQVAHDPSFVQRLTGKICLFDALKPEDYTQIAKDALGDDPAIKTEQELIDMGGTFKVVLSERISRGFDSVEISEEDYKMIGEFVASVPSAARTIVGAGNETGSIAGNLRDALNSKISDIIDHGGTVKNAKFKAEAKKEKDASGSPTINFTIKLVGYNDTQKAEKG